ncbi:YitT family protein [Candidatus Symbiopectobacterium endolongispinus]|uniref:YitT family protein n=1 Tax=Candidatus Symbiopectobacterium endolongispinus TaxID=2812664 RepID=UPI00207ACD91|nr:YitT family protein [Candidatus Symbiopectobacterium endolongispinus]
MPIKTNPLATAHTLKDDIYGLALGVMFIAVGLNLLKFSGMVTGGIAGIALLISYYLPLSIGLLFTLVNIPFLVFCYFSMGRAFTIKTLIVIITLGLATQAVPMLITISYLHPLFAALVGGTFIGFPSRAIMHLLAARVW